MSVKLGILGNVEWPLYELTEREADTTSLDTGFFWYFVLTLVSLCRTGTVKRKRWAAMPG
jgi:hypothetical protein